LKAIEKLNEKEDSKLTLKEKIRRDFDQLKAEAGLDEISI